MDDPKVNAKNRKELESVRNVVRIFREDIGMKFGTVDMHCSGDDTRKLVKTTDIVI